MAFKDNLLAGLAGSLEGARDVLVPFFTSKTQSDLRRREEAERFERQAGLQRELNQTTLVPYDVASQGGVQSYGGRVQIGPKPVDVTEKRSILKSQAIEILKSGGEIGDVNIIDDTTGTEKKDKKRTAQERVTGNLKEMKSLYEELDKMGGIINTEKGTAQNILARAQSTGIGQSLGGAIGAKAQSIRNRINQIRPLLINDMRQASEMGARGLDSEKELEFYLQAVSDLTKDVQANYNAIKVLDNAYGTGVMGKGKRTYKEALVPGSPPTASDLKVGADFMGGKIKNIRYINR